MKDYDAETLNLGGRIRKAREKVGISMRELARRADTNPSTVTRIEKK
jgi:transcriptional regulator with XRE-family HTH domain